MYSSDYLKKSDIHQGSQTADPAKLTREFLALIRTYTDEKLDLPWWFTPRVEWKRKAAEKMYNVSDPAPKPGNDGAGE